MSELDHVTTKLEAERRVRAWIDAQIASFEHDLAAHGSAFFSAEEVSAMGADQAAEADALLGGAARFALDEVWRPKMAARLAGRVAVGPRTSDMVAEILAAAGSPDAGPLARRVALRGVISLLEERLALETGAIAPIPPAAAQSPATSVASMADEAKWAAAFFAHWADYVDAKLASGKWKADMEANAAPARKLFLALQGNLPFSKVDLRVASDFATSLYKLPKFYDKAKEWSEVPIAGLGAAVAAAKLADPDRRVPMMKKGTVLKHLSNLAAYWDWCKRAGRLPRDAENPFPTHKPKRLRARAARAARPAWSIDLQRQLFTGPVWTGCFSVHRRHRPGPHILRDALFWMPIAGRTMGHRSDELAGALVGHIRFEGGVVYLAIRDSKTDSSERDVPIPQLMLDCGFLEYRVYGRDPEERLFPELIPQGVGKRASEAFSNRFTHHRQKLGAYAEGMDFHALRHNVTTDLANMGDVKDGWIDELTGHESAARRSESTPYTKAIYLQHLKATLDRMLFPVDMSHLFYRDERGKPAPGAREEIQRFTELAEREMQKRATRRLKS